MRYNVYRRITVAQAALTILAAPCLTAAVPDCEAIPSFMARSARAGEINEVAREKMKNGAAL